MHRRHFGIGIILLMAIAAAGVGLRRTGVLNAPHRHGHPRSHTEKSAHAEYPSEAVVTHVADGDTFTTKEGPKVRLLNIDTPETGEAFSIEARKRLEQLVLGKKVRLMYDKEREDGYGRLLCHVYEGDTWVNVLLVREGLAAVYIVKPNVGRMKEVVEAQRAARKAKAGIWSLPPPAGEKYYVSSANSFCFHRPGCKLAKGISPKNMIRIPTRDAALDKGLSGCRTCLP